MTSLVPESDTFRNRAFYSKENVGSQAFNVQNNYLSS